MKNCEICDFIGVPQGTCDECIGSGRSEMVGRSAPPPKLRLVTGGVRPLTAYAIKDPRLSDGTHTLPSGIQYRTAKHNVMEIRTPRKVDPSGYGTRIQWQAMREVGAHLGVEIAPAFWRVDPDAYVMIFPRAIAV
jgi:hypothetical protein